jgi:8-oxo-dGTP pyrophosphatase MutT (NUDIX family)
MDSDVLLSLLDRHRPFDDVEAGFLAETRALVHGTDGSLVCSRRNLAGHITASAFVLSPDRAKALLVHHAKLRKWVQPGGHVEDADPDLAAAAHREAIEETGLAAVRLAREGIFDIDIHPIPDNPRKGEPAHRHYDVRFLFVAGDETVAISDESTASAWVPLAEIAVCDAPSLSRMARKCQTEG